MKKFLIIVFSLFLVVSSFAQEANMNKEQIQSAKIAFFTSEIGLTPEEAEVFWPVYNSYWDKMMKANRMTRKSLGMLKKMEREGKATDTEYKEAVQLYVENLKREYAIPEMYLSEFHKILSPEKIAKMFVAEEAFRVKLMNMWKNPNPKPNQNTNQAKQP